MSETSLPLEPDELAGVETERADARPQRPRPVRSYQLEALLRRRDAASGAVRAALDARIEQLRAALPPELLACESEARPARQVTALSKLAERLQARQSAVNVTPTPAAASAPQAAPAARPSLLQQTRAVWQKVRTQSHLRRARTKPMENTGPLNSTKLVARTLQVIGEISPGYQQQFIAYLDVLAELDALIGEAPRETIAPKRPGKPRAPRKRKAETPEG